MFRVNYRCKVALLLSLMVFLFCIYCPRGWCAGVCFDESVFGIEICEDKIIGFPDDIGIDDDQMETEEYTMTVQVFYCRLWNLYLHRNDQTWNPNITLEVSRKNGSPKHSYPYGQIHGHDYDDDDWYMLPTSQNEDDPFIWGKSKVSNIGFIFRLTLTGGDSFINLDPGEYLTNTVWTLHRLDSSDDWGGPVGS